MFALKFERHSTPSRNQHGFCFAGALQIDFVKSPGFLKGTIQNGAVKDTKRYMDVLVAAIKKQVGQADGGANSTATAAPGSTGADTAAGEGTGKLGAAHMGALILLAIAMLVLAIVVGMVGSRIAGAIEQLAGAMQQQQPGAGSVCSGNMP